MATFKNFSLAGVAPDIQLGKGGIRLIDTAGALSLKNAAGIADIALSVGDINSSGNLNLSSVAASISIGGNTLIERSTGGFLKLSGTGAVVLPAGDTAQRPATGELGMVRVNNNGTAVVVEYFNGTEWVSLATGGNTTSLQTEVDNIEAGLGAMFDASGVFQGSALTAANSTVWATAPSDLTTALDILADFATGKDTLDEILPAAAPGNVIYANAEGKWTAGAVGATSNVQGYDEGLAALAAKTSTGIMVQTGDNTYTSTELVVVGTGLAVTNGSGVAGNISIALADDLAAIEALAGTGFAVRTAENTWAQRSITGTTDRIVVTNGDGVTSSPSIDLAPVSQSDTGSFVKVTLDGFGRVTGNTPVVASDITNLVDSTYVNLSGDTMSGNLDFAGIYRITGLADPISSSDAVTKNYVDNAVSGLTWKNAVVVLSPANVDLAAAPAVLDGVTLADGDRVLLTGQTVAADNGIYVYNAATSTLTRALDADQVAELNGSAVFVRSGTYADTGWVQTAELTAFTGQSWTQFSGAGAYAAGTGIAINGNQISARLGAGVTDLPTGEIGLDLHSATGALILTVDGSTRSTDTASRLHLLLDVAGALEQDAAGLRVKAAGITNDMLLNRSITLDADSGTGVVALGSTLNIVGDAAKGIVTSVTDGTITISANDATSASKGVASFDATDFTVTSGAVTLNTVGVAKGGTGLTSLEAGQLLIGNGTSPVAQSADLTFNSTTKYLTVGNVYVDGVNGAIGSTNATDTLTVESDLALATGKLSTNLVLALAGNGVTVNAGTGSVEVALAGSNKVKVTGVTATEYATGLADNDLVNKKYVDQSVTNSTSGTVRAITATASFANGTTTIGTIAAGAIVTRVKVVVGTADVSANVSVGSLASPSAYMTSAEVDAQTAGIYTSETYVVEAAETVVYLTVDGAAVGTTGSATVILEYIMP